MATNVQGTAAGRPQRGYLADQGFFVRYAIVLAIFILIGFAQFTLRGFSSPWTAPPIVHLHGATMIAWLGIFIAQNMLVHRGELAIHRKLGWLAAGLLVLITATGRWSATMRLRSGGSRPSGPRLISWH